MCDRTEYVLIMSSFQRGCEKRRSYDEYHSEEEMFGGVARLVFCLTLMVACVCVFQACAASLRVF